MKKTVLLILLCSLSAFADELAVENKESSEQKIAATSAVCQGWYTMASPNQNTSQNQVMCYPIYGYGYGGGYGGYGYGYGGGWNNGYNNGYNNNTAPQMRSNCAGYTLYEVSTGRQVTCQ